LTDGYNNYNIFTSWLHIVDTIAPTIVPIPDFNVTLGTTGHFLRWEVYDINPSLYEISLDSISLVPEMWTDTNIIEIVLYTSHSQPGSNLIMLDITAPGFHEIEIHIWDVVGNEAWDKVLIYVFEEGGEPTTSEPTDSTSEPSDTQATITTTSGFGVIFLIPITISLALMIMYRRKK
jgi:hypothetical protein